MKLTPEERELVLKHRREQEMLSAGTSVEASPSPITFYTDGATEGFNGRLGTVTHVGIGVYSPGLNLRITKRYAGISNNEAEFLALIEALKYCHENKITTANFLLDSMIVVNRANGHRPKKLKHQNTRMDAFQTTVLALTKDRRFTFNHIPREQNLEADILSKASLHF
jgi:ribonuclease HI